MDNPLPKEVTFELTILHNRIVRMSLRDRSNNDILDCTFYMSSAPKPQKDELDLWVKNFKQSFEEAGVV